MIKHGWAVRDENNRRSRLYGIWTAMKNRCLNAESVVYADYGGRGIKICDEWKNDFRAFMRWALESGYEPHLQIDRFPDNDGDYSPGNCRWATSKKNCRNRRNNTAVAAFGESKCIAEWAEDARCAVSRWTLALRLRMGWDAERAITKHSRQGVATCP